ncbi:MAG: aminotransferase class IV [Caldilineaceae bacterium]|nr:aminotransferase class IV [Caldilineaceae bacterium]
MLQRFYEANRDLLVNINGRFVHRDEAGISPFDSAVQNGDAVWEGLRLYNGRIFKLREHLARLQNGARALAYQGVPTSDEIVEQLRRTLTANGMRDSVHIRLTLSRGVKYTSGMDPRLNNSGTTLIILAEHKPPVYARGGIRLITSAIRRIPPECLDQKIHSCNMLNSILAKIQANSAGVDDAVMLDLNGFVAETNATHLFLVSDSALATPHTHACPEGITRATVLDLCREHGIRTAVRNISLPELYSADELFCTGTLGELSPVIELDGRVIGQGESGPVSRRLSQLYADLTASSGFPILQSS